MFSFQQVLVLLVGATYICGQFSRLESHIRFDDWARLYEEQLTTDNTVGQQSTTPNKQEDETVSATPTQMMASTTTNQLTVSTTIGQMVAFTPTDQLMTGTTTPGSRMIPSFQFDNHAPNPETVVKNKDVVHFYPKLLWKSRSKTYDYIDVGAIIMKYAETCDKEDVAYWMNVRKKLLTHDQLIHHLVPKNKCGDSEVYEYRRFLKSPTFEKFVDMYFPNVDYVTLLVEYT